MASLQGLGGANIPPCFSVFKRLQNVVHVPARRGPPSWPRAGAAGTGALEREAFKGMRHSHDALQPRVPRSLFLRPCRPGAPWRRAGELLLCFLFGVPQRFSIASQIPITCVHPRANRCALTSPSAPPFTPARFLCPIQTPGFSASGFLWGCVPQPPSSPPGPRGLDLAGPTWCLPTPRLPPLALSQVWSLPP